MLRYLVIFFFAFSFSKSNIPFKGTFTRDLMKKYRLKSVKEKFHAEGMEFIAKEYHYDAAADRFYTIAYDLEVGDSTFSYPFYDKEGRIYKDSSISLPGGDIIIQNNFYTQDGRDSLCTYLSEHDTTLFRFRYSADTTFRMNKKNETVSYVVHQPDGMDLHYYKHPSNEQYMYLHPHFRSDGSLEQMDYISQNTLSSYDKYYYDSKGLPVKLEYVVDKNVSAETIYIYSYY